jgi:hypothetical protein
MYIILYLTTMYLLTSKNENNLLILKVTNL